VYDYNLAYDYTNGMPEYFLTTGPYDCTGVADVELRFWKWLGIENGDYDHARVQVSANGADWDTVWEHTGPSGTDDAWEQFVFDISSVADDQATVYVRWGMGPTDSGVSYPGWTIDDFELWGLAPLTPELLGDVDDDGDVDLGDFATFANCYGGTAVTVPPPGCTPEQFEACDLDGDTDVDLADFSTFAINYTG
jgi:hypothetical protein